jgi:adenosylhomocysteine nucleosidase
VSAAPPPAGIVTGLVAEADCLRGATLNEAVPIVFCSGGSAERARDGARQLAGDGVAGLVSFGIAGGLDPHLRPGTILLPHFVLAENGTRFETAREWRERVSAEAGKNLSIAAGTIAGRDRPVLGAQEKRALFEKTGAAAVDMESHAVAEVAREAGLPFLAVRAIADPAARSVPPWALAGIGPEGQTRPLAVLAEIAFRPWEWPALFHLARDTAAAMAGLRRVADLGALLSVPL